MEPFLLGDSLNALYHPITIETEDADILVLKRTSVGGNPQIEFKWSDNTSFKLAVHNPTGSLIYYDSAGTAHWIVDLRNQ